MKRNRLGACVAAAGLVATAALATATVVTRDDGTQPAPENPVFEAAAAPTVTVAPPTSSTLPPLPVPDAPPEDPYADVPVTRIGTIGIPKIGLTHDVYEGVWLTVLNEGPGHWPNSAMPGARGNTVFPAHRTTYSRPFHDLDQLVPGDEIVFEMADADYVYAVRETIVVDPKALWVVDQTETPTVTLIACHPKGSARQRIVVKGDLVRSVPHVAAGQEQT